MKMEKFVEKKPSLNGGCLCTAALKGWYSHIDKVALEAWPSCCSLYFRKA